MSKHLLPLVYTSQVNALYLWESTIKLFESSLFFSIIITSDSTKN